MTTSIFHHQFLTNKYILVLFCLNCLLFPDIIHVQASASNLTRANSSSTSRTSSTTQTSSQSESVVSISTSATAETQLRESHSTTRTLSVVSSSNSATTTISRTLSPVSIPKGTGSLSQSPSVTATSPSGTLSWPTGTMTTTHARNVFLTKTTSLIHFTETPTQSFPSESFSAPPSESVSAVTTQSESQTGESRSASHPSPSDSGTFNSASGTDVSTQSPSQSIDSNTASPTGLDTPTKSRRASMSVTASRSPTTSIVLSLSEMPSTSESIEHTPSPSLVSSASHSLSRTNQQSLSMTNHFSQSASNTSIRSGTATPSPPSPTQTTTVTTTARPSASLSLQGHATAIRWFGGPQRDRPVLEVPSSEPAQYVFSLSGRFLRPMVDTIYFIPQRQPVVSRCEDLWDSTATNFFNLRRALPVLATPIPLAETNTILSQIFTGTDPPNYNTSSFVDCDEGLCSRALFNASIAHAGIYLVCAVPAGAHRPQSLGLVWAQPQRSAVVLEDVASSGQPFSTVGTSLFHLITRDAVQWGSDRLFMMRSGYRCEEAVLRRFATDAAFRAAGLVGELQRWTNLTLPLGPADQPLVSDASTASVYPHCTHNNCSQSFYSIFLPNTAIVGDTISMCLQTMNRSAYYSWEWYFFSRVQRATFFSTLRRGQPQNVTVVATGDISDMALYMAKECTDESVFASEERKHRLGVLAQNTSVRTKFNTSQFILKFKIYTYWNDAGVYALCFRSAFPRWITLGRFVLLAIPTTKTLTHTASDTISQCAGALQFSISAADDWGYRVENQHIRLDIRGNAFTRWVSAGEVGGVLSPADTALRRNESGFAAGEPIFPFAIRVVPVKDSDDGTTEAMVGSIVVASVTRVSPTTALLTLAQSKDLLLMRKTIFELVIQDFNFRCLPQQFSFTSGSSTVEVSSSSAANRSRSASDLSEATLVMGMSHVAIQFPVVPAFADGVIRRQAIGGSAIATVGLLALLSTRYPGAMLPAQGVLIPMFASCVPHTDKRIYATIAGYALAPLPQTFSSTVITLVCLAMIIVLSGGHFVMALVLFRRGARAHRSASSSSPVSVKLTDCLSRLRFPAVPCAVATVLWTAVVSHGARAAFSAGSTGTAVGIITMAVFGAAFVAYEYAAFRLQYQPSRGRFLPHPRVLAKYVFFRSRGHWVNIKQLRMFHFGLVELRPHGRSGFFIPLVCNLGMALVCAAEDKELTSGCYIQLGLAACVAVATGVFFIAVGPLRMKFDNLVVGAQYMCLAAATLSFANVTDDFVRLFLVSVSALMVFTVVRVGMAFWQRHEDNTINQQIAAALVESRRQRQAQGNSGVDGGDTTLRDLGGASSSGRSHSAQADQHSLPFCLSGASFVLSEGDFPSGEFSGDLSPRGGDQNGRLLWDADEQRASWADIWAGGPADGREDPLCLPLLETLGEARPRTHTEPPSAAKHTPGINAPGEEEMEARQPVCRLQSIDSRLLGSRVAPHTASPPAVQLNAQAAVSGRPLRCRVPRVDHGRGPPAHAHQVTFLVEPDNEEIRALVADTDMSAINDHVESDIASEVDGELLEALLDGTADI